MTGLGTRSLQGDRNLVQILARMGCTLREGEDFTEEIAGLGLEKHGQIVAHLKAEHALGLSLRTAQREWLKARAWLRAELHGRAS